ncbi:MAG: ABC transporter ATP-binding protein, partial [Clostridia bacterium]|nr:ABC transporter ATP-binding protein [Clostridia bacterium]
YTDRKGNKKVKIVKFKNQYKIEEYTDKKGRAKKRKVWQYDKFITDKVKRALKIVGLTDYEGRDVNSLSGGQQQRVAIARAIVNEPQVLLLDEPLGALDLKMRQEMQLELKEMHRNLGITFIYVTHDQEEALTMSDSIVVMRDGKILQIGSPIDIYNEPINSYVADFIGESNILSGVMKADYKVSFIGHTFKCVDKGFAPDQNVDVVIRPEDWLVSSEVKGAQVKGVITSVLFRGVHYEMECLCNGYTLIIHNVDEFAVGSTVGLCVDPNDIHIMRKEKEFNAFDAVFTANDKVEICGAQFKCAPDRLIDSCVYDSDADIATIGGEEVALKGRQVRLRVDFDKIEIEDDENNAPLAGNIESMIYNGKSYIVSIMTDAGVAVLADTEYLWDKGDRVGVRIMPEDMISLDSVVEDSDAVNKGDDSAKSESDAKSGKA